MQGILKNSIILHSESKHVCRGRSQCILVVLCFWLKKNFLDDILLNVHPTFLTTSCQDTTDFVLFLSFFHSFFIFFFLSFFFLSSSVVYAPNYLYISVSLSITTFLFLFLNKPIGSFFLNLSLDIGLLLFSLFQSKNGDP